MLNIIKNHMIEESKKVLNKDDNYKLVAVEDRFDAMLLKKFGQDIRLSVKELREKSISFILKKNNSNEVVSCYTIFLIDQSNINAIKFWKYNKRDDCLYKICLNDIMKSKTENICMFGLMLTKKNKKINNFLKIILAIVKTSKKINQLFNGYIMMELIGTVSLEDEFLDKTDCISLKEEKNKYIKHNLGNVRNETKIMLQFARFVDLIHIDDLYHIRTLGKVFFGNKLKNSYKKNLKYSIH